MSRWWLRVFTKPSPAPSITAQTIPMPQEYDRAASLFKQVDGELSQDAIIVQLQRTTRKRAATRRLAPAGQVDPRTTKTSDSEAAASSPRSAGLALVSRREWLLSSTTMQKAAAENFQAAVDGAQALPEFDETARLTFKQRLGFSYIRLGEGAKSGADIFATLSLPSRESRVRTALMSLRVRLNLAQAFMIEKKHEEAVKEATAIYPEFVSRLGPDHELTMQLLTTRAQSEGSLELWDDAVRDDLAIYDLAVKKQGRLRSSQSLHLLMLLSLNAARATVAKANRMRARRTRYPRKRLDRAPD